MIERGRKRARIGRELEGMLVPSETMNNRVSDECACQQQIFVHKAVTTTRTARGRLAAHSVGVDCEERDISKAALEGLLSFFSKHFRAVLPEDTLAL